ncbi:MAG: hypothetical protein ABSD20_18370 [Terriglobales bacterium]|jgi:hypothetical protein
MSEAAQAAPEAHQEFWRPPSPVAAEEMVVQEAVPVMAEVCPRCSSEFLLGSRFCHTCGERRPEAVHEDAHSDAAVLARVWEQGVARIYSVAAGLSEKSGRVWDRIQFPAWLQRLHFHEIQSFFGLSTASLVAFVIGLGCVAGALMVGLLTAKTFVDWQAIQFYRAEWLLAATAAFVAGILLKKPSKNDGE